MVEPWRVAQIVVRRGPDDDGSRGSGYLTAPGRVLTAAHVVAGASAVRVRLDVGQRTEVDVQAETWWADPAGHKGSDLAVIAIPEDATAGREIEPALFGRIADCTAVLIVQVFGFPRFKLRTDLADVQMWAFRDFEQAVGHTPVAANRRQGTLAVYLDDPSPAPPSPRDPSPWEGMSGAPVWTAGRIVGVVAEHHPTEGTGRLTARRIDRGYEELSAFDLGALAEQLGLPASASGLPDVVPAEPRQLVQSAYRAQVRDIAPDSLIGRDSELADWAEFCAGADPYAWWQAGPWAGKSALASWFVMHPPAGVDVVSFFITGRLYGQADSDAFLDGMIEQLNALYPAGAGSPAVAGARAGAWLNLLASAAAHSQERARRLVVVVDGLDEDDAGATPPRGRPSIASLLPRRPPANVRLIVTSRPDPGLPDDLPGIHPLRGCAPRPLPVSWVAEDVALRAKQELRDLLAGHQIAIDVVGYIAGSGGGLTRSDLSALAEAPPHKLDPILRGVFGRSLYTRASADLRDPHSNPATRVYLFAHETLRVTAEEQLGDELARYREKVHNWIGSYAGNGWPETTPGYAIRGYRRLLVATSDITRLSALARDPRRHAFLLLATGSDYAALSEITTAQSLIADKDAPDLRALVELAVYRHAISIRNQSIPADLPSVWARLARIDHAEALARTITNPDDQARALGGVATAIAQAGDPDRAEALTRTITNPDHQARALADLAGVAAQASYRDRAFRLAIEAEALARTITNPDHQARALAGVATAIAQAGDPDRAIALARTITNPDDQARAQRALATAIVQAGNPDRAIALARTITNPDDQARALAGVATAIAQAGDPDRAEALARTITNPGVRADMLTSLAGIAAQADNRDRAFRPATEAEALARAITSLVGQAWALRTVATAIAQAGDPDRAEAFARTITNPDDRTEMLVGLAEVAAQAGNPDRAFRLATEAEALARTLTNPDDQAWALRTLATAIAQAGDPDRAEALTRNITNPHARARALASVATAIARDGDPDRAEALTRTITNPGVHADTLTSLAGIAAQAGNSDRAFLLAAEAEALARTLTNPDDRVSLLAGVATVVAQAGDPDGAEALARTITVSTGEADSLTLLAAAAAQARALAGVTAAIAQAGHLDRAFRLATEAEALARTITNPHDQADALAGVATVIAQAGDPGRAETLARTIRDPDDRADMLASLAGIAAQAGHRDHAFRLATEAEALARSSTNPDDQAWALRTLATATAQAGDPDRAETLARTIRDPGVQADTLACLASVAAQSDDLDRTGRLLALALVTDPLDTWWVVKVSRFFPSVIAGAWDVLVGAYTTRG
jgi:lipopolysaccharide biosynthesis regulator YciM